MPFIANTPESLIDRSDSKNPATTCRGITSGGRPCRRPLAADSVPSPRTKYGRLRADDPRDETLYCWQHKEQASMSARSSPGPRMSNTPILEERTSLDTLADRLGLVQAARTKTEKASKPTRPSAGKNGYSTGGTSRPAMMTRPKPKAQVSFCFCFKIPVDEVNPLPRPKPHVIQPTTVHMPGGVSSVNHLAPTSSRPRPSLSAQSQASGRSSRHSSAPSATPFQTAHYLSLIPASVSPATASLLMAELAKPFSSLDEPGYIYMFWLTPETQPAAPADAAARDLLAPPLLPRGGGGRRPSDVIASYAAAATAGGGGARGGKSPPKTILLKIGRATNVQRRLNEWKRQCGYNLSLIRYYPYISGSSSGAVPVTPRKMPHSHRVERLIHLELGGAGMKALDARKCTACGREHREWFEVEATRDGVQAVDGLVKRWVEWDEARLR